MRETDRNCGENADFVSVCAGGTCTYHYTCMVVYCLVYLLVVVLGLLLLCCTMGVLLLLLLSVLIAVYVRIAVVL
jgi:hypothetical protein